MSSIISPAKVLLLAVNSAAQGNLGLVYELASRYRDSLRPDLLLRIVLTYLPETTPPSDYVEVVRRIAHGIFEVDSDAIIDSKDVDNLTEEVATKKARKLQLLPLQCPDAPRDGGGDFLTSFVIHRAYRMDEEAGMLDELLSLISPFLEHDVAIRSWMTSTVLPLSRRNAKHYREDAKSYTLRQFQNLDDTSAAKYLLSGIGQEKPDIEQVDQVGEDLRRLVSPWLHNKSRWTTKDPQDEPTTMPTSLGWEHVLEWLVLNASKNWQIAVQAIEHWDGPSDVDFEGVIVDDLLPSQLRMASHSYARAAIASAYSLPEPSLAALDGAHRMVNRARSISGLETFPSLYSVADKLPPITQGILTAGDTKLIMHLRHNLLGPTNVLTEPSFEATNFLTGVILSAFILTRSGVPCTVRRAGTLTLLRDVREQKSELMKAIRHISNHAPRNDDDYWSRARLELLWLYSWGQANHTANEETTWGVLGMVPRDAIEVEILRAMLSNMRYTLVKAVYEDAASKPLADDIVREAVYYAALDAFDNASNPNRTRGGLKKCNDINQAFPKIVPPSLPTRRQVESLLSAAHALSTYRLVLKQGEPFTPVMLRVHSDPISIIDKVLDQNKGAYTRLQEFLELGVNLVNAGFPTRRTSTGLRRTSYDHAAELYSAEKRILSMCISAALKEDDFETAYSYVVSRLGQLETTTATEGDTWSWRAALMAGQYMRTSRSRQPTHLGTSSGNLEIRHLEQRLECLATALRVAPASSLQGVLESFCQCEGQLELAVADEAAKEAAWDVAGDSNDIPGAFDNFDSGKMYPPRNATASTTSKQTEEAPMSLFDLSRATAGIAQRNLTALSSLRGLTQGTQETTEPNKEDHAGDVRTRKRDQFRDAATGTLVSGVGWLIGAKPS